PSSESYHHTHPSFSLLAHPALRSLVSFPTRRSSDLGASQYSPATCPWRRHRLALVVPACATAHLTVSVDLEHDVPPARFGVIPPRLNRRPGTVRKTFPTGATNPGSPTCPRG